MRSRMTTKMSTKGTGKEAMTASIECSRSRKSIVLMITNKSRESEIVSKSEHPPSHSLRNRSEANSNHSLRLSVILNNFANSTLKMFTDNLI